MVFKSAAIGWLGGGALLVGYAGFAWLRSKRAAPHAARFAAAPSHDDVEPLSARLEHVPEELALDLESDFELPANSNRALHRSDLGAQFFSRATNAFSPFASDRAPPTARVPR